MWSNLITNEQKSFVVAYQVLLQQILVCNITLIDITERKEAEAALRNSKEKWSSK
jgi:hypothetical protein